jgi:hypothetical protein
MAPDESDTTHDAASPAGPAVEAEGAEVRCPACGQPVTLGPGGVFGAVMPYHGVSGAFGRPFCWASRFEPEYIRSRMKATP